MVARGELADAAGTLSLGGELDACRMGFGAMWMTDAHPEPCTAVLRRAVELGIELIDTADVYGEGSSERMVARALHPYPEGVVIATKGGQTLVDGQPRADGRPEHLRRACESSLRRLGLDTIDLYQLHMPDPQVPLEESLGALAELQAEGKVRLIGLSNVFGDQLERSLSALPIASLQNQLNLADRGSERELAACERDGVAYIPYRPLAGGSLAGEDGGAASAAAPREAGSRGDVAGALREVASAHGSTTAQVALAWLLARSPAMLPIPGTTSIQHLEQNVAAARLRLTAEELALLESAGAPG